MNVTSMAYLCLGLFVNASIYQYLLPPGCWIPTNSWRTEAWTGNWWKVTGGWLWLCVCVCWHGQVYGSIWCLLTRIVIVSFVLSVTGSCKHSCLWSSLCFIWGWAKYPRQQHWSSSSDPLLPKENRHRNWTISERGVSIVSLFRSCVNFPWFYQKIHF